VKSTKIPRNISPSNCRTPEGQFRSVSEATPRL
jgi:hypothetical protein